MLALDVEQGGRAQGARPENFVVGAIGVAHRPIAVVEPVDQPRLLPIDVPIRQALDTQPYRVMDTALRSDRIDRRVKVRIFFSVWAITE